MPTNNYIENSFWNFDALFQPQQHPARDAHDTFFISEPALSDKFPQDYLDRVRRTHIDGGGYGSQGYQYEWKVEEAQKNILRTHTTACSARMLYKLAVWNIFASTIFLNIMNKYVLVNTLSHYSIFILIGNISYFHKFSHTSLHCFE